MTISAIEPLNLPMKAENHKEEDVLMMHVPNIFTVSIKPHTESYTQLGITFRAYY